MSVIGYARVSTTDQDLDIQVTALKREGCGTIRSEKRSGTTTEGREELRTVLDFLREGDVLMVTRIDRLARSIGDLQDIVRAVRARGASLKATEQPIDTSTAAGKCFLDMLGVFAEFETNLRRERQLEGIAKAKAAGVYKGRPASIDATQVRAMKAQGLGPRKLQRPSRSAGRRSIGCWRQPAKSAYAARRVYPRKLPSAPSAVATGMGPGCVKRYTQPGSTADSRVAKRLRDLGLKAGHAAPTAIGC
jgi:DNA invertase Pin-like site-specific DNA recombinase